MSAHGPPDSRRNARCNDDADRIHNARIRIITYCTEPNSTLEILINALTAVTRFMSNGSNGAQDLAVHQRIPAIFVGGPLAEGVRDLFEPLLSS